MYGIYLALVRHKDHVLFALSLFLSSFLLLNNSNPLLENITISGNTADGPQSNGCGGGISLNDAADPTLKNITISSKKDFSWS